VLSEYINANRPPTSEEAFLLQRAAWYSRKEDPTQSAEWQKYAREHEPHLLMPSSGLQYQKRARTTPNAAAQFAEWLSKFEHASAAVAAIQHLRSHLVFSPDAPSELFERALRDLGEILGFESSRPDKEFHVGPDVLWMDGQIASPLEAKNNTSPDTPAISKDNAGQLAQSAAWASKFHSERTKIVPLIAHPRTAVSDAAFLPANTRVLTPEHLTGILDALASAVAGVQRLAGKPSVDSAAQRLGEHGLSLERIIAMHTAKPGG
jgi:hypothetical protein